MRRADENASSVVVKGQRSDSHEAVKSPNVAASVKGIPNLESGIETIENEAKSGPGA